MPTRLTPRRCHLPIILHMETLTLFALAAIILADPIVACQGRLVSYADWRETADTSWSLDLAASGGGHLNYRGIRHSRDPADPQFGEVAASYRSAQPTVVFYEGPDRGVGADGPETIRTRGESGFARWLAQENGARTESLEPSPIDQFHVLAARFPAEQVELFFVLREVVRLRDREQKRGSALDDAAQELLVRLNLVVATTEVVLPFNDLATLDQTYSRYWPDGSDWRDAPAAWFDPTAEDADTGGQFMATINAASSEFRNFHMYRQLARSAISGERVFAVVGRNHVPMQAEALRCALR